MIYVTKSANADCLVHVYISLYITNTNQSVYLLHDLSHNGRVNNVYTICFSYLEGNSNKIEKQNNNNNTIRAFV